MKYFNNSDYLSSKSYLSFLFNSIRRGNLWSTVGNIYKKLRKYTIISAIMRTFAILIALIEKSAILLLFVSSMFLLLPAALILFTLFALGSIFNYIAWHKDVKPWLDSADKIVVYITSEKIMTKPESLLLRTARYESSLHLYPVIVVSSDKFNTSKWLGFNLLAVKIDYFYILKKYYFSKSGAKFVFMVT